MFKDENAVSGLGSRQKLGLQKKLNHKSESKIPHVYHSFLRFLPSFRVIYQKIKRARDGALFEEGERRESLGSISGEP